LRLASEFIHMRSHYLEYINKDSIVQDDIAFSLGKFNRKSGLCISKIKSILCFAPHEQEYSERFVGGWTVEV
jgi:hypothetical protein